MTPNKKLLHEFFAHTAGLFPQHVAVSTDQRDIRYAELNELSDRVARLLIHLGIQREDTIAVYLDKGIEYVAAILGVMKAGGVFLPLDLGLPGNRLAFMLAKTPPKLVLTNQAGAADVLGQLPQGLTPPVLYLDAEGRLTASHPTPSAPAIVHDTQAVQLPAVDPKDASYIVYTSGSTGNPKAVVGVHQSLSHFIHWEAKEFGFNETSRVSQFPPVSFDASLKDIFVPLVAGGRVCIPPRGTLDSGANLVNWLERKEITVMHCVPALFRLVLREIEERAADEPRVPTLRQVIIAGDVLFASDVLRWRARLGDRVPLANLYGLTETTVLKTFHRIKEVSENPREIIHVGQPIANTAILIVKDGRLCDIGQIGELYIKSPFLTRGYLDNDEPTNNRFVQNPLNSDPDIVFKTGDLGRYRSDRSIELLGRLDNQVKVQGNRVELSEIEKNLLGHPAIDQVVVLALKGDEGDHTLACYYTEKQANTSEELRTYLGEYLPSYMIPSFFVRMDKFPLNINGKINRKALPKPEQVIFGAAGYVAPATEIEQGLEAIWREVLALGKVSVTAPFFEVGGHSLKATRIVSRISRAFHVDISLAAFFSNPTIRELAVLIEKQRAAELPGIAAIADAESYAVSHGQHRLWILHQIDEHRTAYSMPGAYMLTGELSRDSLQRAFATLIARHESLRTTFVFQNGELRQRVHATIPGGVVIDSHDLSAQLNATETEAALMGRLAREDASQPFDLESGPLLRIKLFRLSALRNVVLLNIHHSICDGWSMDVLGSEWIALYHAYAANKPSPLAPLKLQYRDYAAWQNGLLASESGRALGAYWHEIFAQPVTPLELTTDFPRPPVSSYRGVTLLLPFEHELVQKWTAFAKQHETTLFQSLTALVMTLLHRQTGQQDIVVGTPVAGRTHPDLESQVGFFVNMLALRMPVHAADPFTAVLSRMKHVAVAAYDHQAYPFDRLVDELHLKRQTNRAPLFDVMVALENPEISPAAADQLNIHELPFDTGTSRFDLTLIFVAHGGDMELKVNFNPELFATERIQRLGRQLQAVMHGVLGDPDRAVGELDLLDVAERQQVLHTFQGTARAFPHEQTLIDLFTAQVAATPHGSALIHEDNVLTYAELQQRAAALAQWLIETHDLRPGEVCGLMVERGEASVVGMLGIIMAGAVFLPLDPFYPTQRLEYMLADSSCKLVITQPQFRAVCRTTVPLGEYPEALLSGATAKLPVRRSRCAAVIFTSGSTGRPKGALLPHQGLVNMALGLGEIFAIQPADRVLQFAAYSFDVFLAEVWMTLLAGACLVVVDRRRIDDPQGFLTYCDDHRVTVGAMPAAYLNALDRPALASFRLLITGGEAPNVATAEYYARRLRYFNAYGLTEASAYSTVYEVQPGREYAQFIPIGKPLPNTFVYILDEALRPVPVGTIGELFIGGCGLAQEYVNDPERTAARFVPSPFRPGERLYKTGDRGRFLSEGDIQFLGRSDNQVKVRGYRIELGEIERTLLMHPAVKECCVTHLAALGELAAYYVGNEQAVDAQTLGAYLSLSLPDYMIPSHFLRLANLPLSPNGKIDKAALPDPRTPNNSRTARQPPRNPTERRILEIWSKVLSVAETDVDADFFALGGHSIHVVSLVSQLRSALGVPVSPRDIYLNPTVAGLTQALRDQLRPAAMLTTETSATAVPAGGIRVQVERRPLLTLLASGELAPVDAVAVDYLSDDLIKESGASEKEIITQWCSGLPVFSGVRELPTGRIGFITLPRFGSQLFGDPAALRRELEQTLKMATFVGARAVSLTGMLAAATDYGRMLTPLLHDKALQVTTGHDTVTATLLASLHALLTAAGRQLSHERVGIVGLGSIGSGVLGLMLDNLGHPPELLLFDAHKDARELTALQQRITVDHRYAGKLRVLPSGTKVPDSFYEATLVISATDSSDLLDVDRLAPGTLLLTDSGRYGFALERALGRLRTVGDLLLTEGDVIHLGQPAPTTLYLPEFIAEALSLRALRSFLQRDPATITGCVLSALLTSKGVPPTTGPVTTAAAQQHVHQLAALGLRAAPLHIHGETLSAKSVSEFRSHHGSAVGDPHP